MQSFILSFHQLTSIPTIEYQAFFYMLDTEQYTQEKVPVIMAVKF